MKIGNNIILIVLALSPLFVFCQGVVEIFDYPTLYRDVENTIRVGSTQGQKDFMLSSKDCRIEKLGNDWTVTVSSKSILVDLYVLNNSGDTLSKKEFQVISLPDPFLCLGLCADGDMLYNRSQKKLYVKNPSWIQVPCNYTIRNWEISIDGYKKKLKGKGDFLTEEALKIIGFAPKGAFITIRANCVNTKGKKLTLTSTLKL